MRISTIKVTLISIFRSIPSKQISMDELQARSWLRSKKSFQKSKVVLVSTTLVVGINEVVLDAFSANFFNSNSNDLSLSCNKTGYKSTCDLHKSSALC